MPSKYGFTVKEEIEEKLRQEEKLKDLDQIAVKINPSIIEILNDLAEGSNEWKVESNLVPWGNVSFGTWIIRNKDKKRIVEVCLFHTGNIHLDVSRSDISINNQTILEKLLHQVTNLHINANSFKTPW